MGPLVLMDGQEVKWSIGALKFGKFICSCYIADRGQHMRQIHIRKDETVYEGGAVPAKALRPVTVQSILVRILRSAFVSQPEVCQWVMSKACECCHGALFSRGVATASLAEAMEETKRAFTCVLQLYSHMWQNQRRWLQLGRATATETH